MVEGLVSIVIPIYNVEKYLDRCIQSIVNQTYTKLEIILVDDGSPDRCPRMCDEWALKDRRIVVIHKENEGLGHARNTGIENANGEYICFFDSDDYVENDLIERCYSTAKCENADIVCFGNDYVTENGNVLKKRIPMPPKLYFRGKEVKDILLPRLVSYNAATGENWKLLMSAWTVLISMKTIHAANWRFVSEREIISEDIYSMFEIYQCAQKVFFLQEVFYHYVVNPNSLSRSYRRDRYDKVKHFAISMQTQSEKMGCNVEAEIATLFLGLLMGVLRQLVASNESIRFKMRMLREIVNDDYLQCSLHSNDMSGDDLQKRILYWALKRKQVLACYLLAFLRNLLGST